MGHRRCRALSCVCIITLIVKEQLETAAMSSTRKRRRSFATEPKAKRAINFSFHATTTPKNSSNDNLIVALCCFISVLIQYIGVIKSDCYLNNNHDYFPMTEAIIISLSA